MSERKIAVRYARAFFQSAEEQHTTEAVNADLAALRALIHASEPLQAFLNDAALSAARQRQTLDALFEGRIHTALLRFMRFLAERGRLGLLADIGDAFRGLYHDARGILPVEIRTADTLRDDQLAAIRERLAARYGKRIDATVTVDPSLLGGFRVRAVDTIHDFSIRGHLDSLRRALQSA